MASYHAISSVCIDYDTVTICLELFHNITPSASVNNWCGFYYTSCRKLNLNSPLLWGICSYLTHYEAFYILQNCKIFLIIFQWSIPGILIHAKISRIYILSQGESYFSILELLTAEAYGTYFIRSIFLLELGQQILKLITLDYQGRLYFVYILSFLISFQIMSYAIILIPLQLSISVSLNSNIKKLH